MAYSVYPINSQSEIRSKPVNYNFQALVNAVNTLQTQVNQLSTAGSDNEVVQARDSKGSLSDRNKVAGFFTPPHLSYVGSMTEVDPMVIEVAGVEGFIGGKVVSPENGSSIYFSFTAPTLLKQIAIGCINQDNTYSITYGVESNTEWLMPNVPNNELNYTSLQRPLIIAFLTNSTTSLTPGTDLFFCYEQGVICGRHWYWTINDAIQGNKTDASNLLYPKKITVLPGYYYETIIEFSNFHIEFDPNAKLYDEDGSARDILAIDTTGESNFYITNGNKVLSDNFQKTGSVDAQDVTSDQISTDTINEKTSGAGVTIDTMLIKDAQPYTDQINEKTSGAGVTIDGVLLKDGKTDSRSIHHGYLQSTTSTFGNVYDLLSPLIPNTNDIMNVNALIDVSSALYGFTHAKRSNASTILLYGMKFTNFALWTETIQSSTSTAISHITMSY